MSLINHITINYQPVYTSFISLNKEEWSHMIKIFLNKLVEKPVGRILSEKLLYYVRNGYSLIIQNHDFPLNTTVYPKIRYINSKSVLIVIPSIPYFTTIDIVDPVLCEGVSDKFFSNLLEAILYKPAKFKINIDEHGYLLSQGKQTGFITLVHELIHCLRKWEGMYVDDPLEEDNTIYGIEGSVLSCYDDTKKIYITENSIRKEWGMDARISHNCKDIFCMYIPSTHNKSNNFTIDSYFECV